MIEIIQISLILICIFGEALYSGMETGIISIRRIRLHHHVKLGNKKALILKNFLDNPDHLLGTTLVGTNLCIVITSVLTSNLAVQYWGVWGKTVSAFLISAVLLVVSEYIPKAWFQARPYDNCIKFAGFLEWSWHIFKPIGMLVTQIARLIVPVKISEKQMLSILASRTELKVLASEGVTYGEITPEERTMIHRAIELSEKTARKIMVPIEKSTVIKSNITKKEFLELSASSEYTRYPVFDAEQNKFIGVINMFDVIASAELDSENTLESLVKEIVLIPADLPADEVVPLFRRGRQPIGLVVNPQKKVVGLITTEDILEQIVGTL
jgi:CBS domain containing-hemolysin-like protein